MDDPYGPDAQRGYETNVAQPQIRYVHTKTNGYAIASLVLGIVWMYWVASILALIFGYIAKRQIDRSGGLETGRGMAIAGIVLGWVGIGILLLFIIYVVAGGSLE